jgi:phosphoglycolate phosphatase-like HAD superfamily hydrolase
MNKCVIFDFDGIIADSNKLKIDILSQILSEFFDFPKHKIADLLVIKSPGLNRVAYIEVLEKIKEIKIDKKKILSKINEKMNAALKDVKINPYLKEMREYNQSVKWFIITSGNENEVKSYLTRHLIISYFLDIKGGNGNKFLSYLDLLEKYKIEKDNLIVIGDGSKDYDLIKKISCLGLLVSEWSQEPGFLTSINEPDINIIDTIKNLSLFYKKII